MTSHDQIAHRWAQRPDPATRAGSARGHAMFFNDDTIYSYGPHFPIAKWVDPPKGPAVVLFTSESYSVTTAKHKSIVHRAIPQSVRAFVVPTVRAASKHYHRENVKALLQASGAALAKSKRARTYKASYLKASARYLEEARAYARLFRTGQRIPASSAKIAEAIEAARKVEAKRDAERRAESERRAEAQRVEDRATFERWRAGDLDASCPRSYAYSATRRAYLAVRGDIVQTSLGAEVPIEHVRRALPLVRAIKERGTEWHRNGQEIRVGHFQIDAIEPDGTIRAGCHVIGWDEVERIAVQVGVTQ